MKHKIARAFPRTISELKAKLVNKGIVLPQNFFLRSITNIILQKMVLSIDNKEIFLVNVLEAKNAEIRMAQSKISDDC